MDPHDLVTGVRWELLQFLSRKPATGADLARQLGTSPANVSQHLKLLELAGLITRERVNGKAMHFRLVKNQALVTILSDEPIRQTIPLSGLSSLELNLLLTQGDEFKILRRMLLEHETLVKSWLGFGLVKEGPNPDIFVISSDVKALRKEYASIKIGDRKITIWSHTPDEINDGLTRKEGYFVDMFNRLRILYDPDRLLHIWKEGHQQ